MAFLAYLGGGEGGLSYLIINYEVSSLHTNKGTSRSLPCSAKAVSFQFVPSREGTTKKVIMKITYLGWSALPKLLSRYWFIEIVAYSSLPSDSLGIASSASHASYRDKIRMLTT